MPMHPRPRETPSNEGIDDADAGVREIRTVSRDDRLGKDENPESQFAENNGIDRHVWLMRAKPLHDSWSGR